MLNLPADSGRIVTELPEFVGADGWGDRVTNDTRSYLEPEESSPSPTRCLYISDEGRFSTPWDLKVALRHQPDIIL